MQKNKKRAAPAGYQMSRTRPVKFLRDRPMRPHVGTSITTDFTLIDCRLPLSIISLDFYRARTGRHGPRRQLFQVADHRIQDDFRFHIFAARHSSYYTYKNALADECRSCRRRRC